MFSTSLCYEPWYSVEADHHLLPASSPQWLVHHQAGWSTPSAMSQWSRLASDPGLIKHLVRATKCPGLLGTIPAYACCPGIILFWKVSWFRLYDLPISKAGFLHFNTINTLSWIILCCREGVLSTAGCLAHNIYPRDAGSTSQLWQARMSSRCQNHLFENNSSKKKEALFSRILRTKKT